MSEPRPPTKEEAIAELRKVFVDGLMDSMGRFEANRFAAIFFDRLPRSDDSIAGGIFDCGVEYGRKVPKS